MVSEAEDRRETLYWALETFMPITKELEVEECKCIGRPWRYLRWRRAIRKHEAINKIWADLLADKITRLDAAMLLKGVMSK